MRQNMRDRFKEKPQKDRVEKLTNYKTRSKHLHLCSPTGLVPSNNYDKYNNNNKTQCII